MIEAIEAFDGEYRWLSNFWPTKVVLDGAVYPSVENAYQAAKTDPSFRAPFQSCSAAQAKRLGKTIPKQSGWLDNRLAVMANLIDQKFAAGTPLAQKLIATHNALLVEGNAWGDTFWGVCCGRGENHLGCLLMQKRSQLKRSQMSARINEKISKTAPLESILKTLA